jgi:hypothetical protein
MDEYAEAARRIQYGSEAEATEALKALTSRAGQQQQSLTLQQVADFVEFREATKWATDEFGDLLGDPIMRGAFANREREMRAAGDNRSYRDIYTEIGSNLRDWIKAKTPAPVVQPAAETREQRKSRIVTIPTAASRQEVSPTPKEPTPSEIVEAMRRARTRSK